MQPIQAGIWKMLANFITGFTTGCAEQPEPFEPQEAGTIVDYDIYNASDVNPWSTLKGWTFCAKKNVVEDKTDDCFENANLADKISTCVYLKAIKSSYNSYNTGIDGDHDKLMTFLLAYYDGEYNHFCFEGKSVC